MKAIITGASKGIGKAIAVKLAQHGYDLGLCARNPYDLIQLKTILDGFGTKNHIYEVDCSDKKQLDTFFTDVKSDLGDVDVLVNNVGLFLTGSMLDEPDETFENQQNVNVNAAYYTSKFFGKMMREQRSGHIFNICSVASTQTIENAGSYCVTKAAMLSLNNVLRQELSKYNVKVTALLPGSTLTASWEGTDIPTDKFVKPEDIADTLFTILNLSKGVNVDEIVIKPLNF